jgi:23S rRNA pseudouridine2605 synthase
MQPRPRRAQRDPGGPERLQKVLAHAGVGSRRSCEEVILQGRVTVDGRVVRELGTRVDPGRQKVAVDGQRIHAERMVYYAVCKPKGYVSSSHDPAGKPRVIDILPEIPERVYTVGRLDEQSTGLMLLTNDGELANCLAHPKFGVEKLYRVVVAGSPTREVLTKLTDGVWLAEGKVRAKRVRVAGTRGQATILEMTLAEGKNREIRRMLAGLGHKVMSLTRTAVGPISLKGLAPGQYRPLTAVEVGLLRKVAAGIPVTPQRSSDRPRPPKRGAARVPAPRPQSQSQSQSQSRSQSGPGPRPGRRVEGGPPPRPATNGPSSRGPHRAPVRPSAPSGRTGADRRPAPVGPSGARPPRHGRQRPGGPPSHEVSGGHSAALPPLPTGPPPSQRPKKPGAPPRPDSEPRRRIIGLEPAPGPGPESAGPKKQAGMRRPVPKHRPHPRAGLGPRRPRPSHDQGE